MLPPREIISAIRQDSACAIAKLDGEIKQSLDGRVLMMGEEAERRGKGRK